jgi:hypothetical protein
MSIGGRAEARRRMLQRAGLAGAIFAVIALVLLASGHWILGLLFALAAAAAIWAFLQLRTLR